MATPRSSTLWLAWGYLALVVYASLYPFGPWSWPGGLGWREALTLHWPRYWLELDLWANALGYAPLGFLVTAAHWRRRGRLAPAWGWGVLLPCLLAYGMELAQRALALRVPSLADWVLNSAGALLGALLAVAMIRRGQLNRLAQWRERWFVPGSAGALALLACWPLALAFPTPAPLAQGQFLPESYAVLRDLLEARGWVQWPDWPRLLGNALADFGASFLGLLAPCSLMLAITRPGWHRAGLVLGALVAGVGMSSLAAVLAFGPDRAWSWPNAHTVPALATATVCALALSLLSARWHALLAVVLLVALLSLVNLMAPDPYLVASQFAWEGGAQVRLYGLLQWLGRLWPLLALLWLLAAQGRDGRAG